MPGKGHQDYRKSRNERCFDRRRYGISSAGNFPFMKSEKQAEQDEAILEEIERRQEITNDIMAENKPEEVEN